MLFNSVGFAFFLPLVFLLYWLVANKSLRQQNLLLLAASCFFYGCWDYRFLFLLFFSIVLDYYTGIKMSEAKDLRSKKFWFWLSVSVNLGFLGVFKYFNFFSASFADALMQFGVKTDTWTLNVILPIGISFYTFHGLSYVIDIYNNRIKPEKNFVDYSLFVSFFPLLVAGPIERATHLLPQLKVERTFNYAKAVDGLRQILWGLFKKVVIADSCAEYANTIFNGYGDYSGSTLLLGALFFTFQIYCDFSGYSDIALGTARLFGVELLRNFAFPYFSRDIAEFWRRWHISLSSWFKDYLYIPLGGSKGGTWMKIRNTFIIFIVSGFWHGANWTFIVWGALNAVYFLPLLVAGKNRTNIETVAQGKYFPSPKEFFMMAGTFALTVLAWIFFRSENLHHAFGFIKGMLNASLFSIPTIRPLNLFLLLFIFIICEWLSREKMHALQFNASRINRPLRFAIYLAITFSILFNHRFHSQSEFIYFQF